MDGKFGYKIWLPAVLTIAVWMVLMFGIAALKSNMWADLIGLMYLMASPFIFGGLKSIIGVNTDEKETDFDRSRMRDLSQ